MNQPHGLPPPVGKVETRVWKENGVTSLIKQIMTVFMVTLNVFLMPLGVEDM